MTKEKDRVTLKFLEGGKCFSLGEEKYADYANSVIKNKSEDFKRLTTTKLRSIYGLIANIYSRIDNEEEFEDSISDLQYLKVKMAYESGREQAVKTFLHETHLLPMLDNIKTYDEFLLYCRYAESLVAYFKYYGGKE